MAQFSADRLTDQEWKVMRHRHKHGDEQIQELYRLGNGFKDSNDDMNFTSPYLNLITAQSLIVHGDRDPFYPIEISLELFRSIRRSALWIVPNGSHVPIFGKQAEHFAETAIAFLTEGVKNDK